MRNFYADFFCSAPNEMSVGQIASLYGIEISGVLMEDNNGKQKTF